MELRPMHVLCVRGLLEILVQDESALDHYCLVLLDSAFFEHFTGSITYAFHCTTKSRLLIVNYIESQNIQEYINTPNANLQIKQNSVADQLTKVTK